MTESSFGNDITPTEAMTEFMNKEPNSVFFTFESMIPSNIKCKVLFRIRFSMSDISDLYIIFLGTCNWKGSVGICRNCFEKRITLYRVHGYQSNENNRTRTIGEA